MVAPYADCAPMGVLLRVCRRKLITANEEKYNCMRATKRRRGGVEQFLSLSDQRSPVAADNTARKTVHNTNRAIELARLIS